MKRIQVTTARIDSAAQVILPNTYFVTKTVKAMLACDELNKFAKETQPREELPYPFIEEKLETIGNFLHELVDAMEGNED